MTTNNKHNQYRKYYMMLSFEVQLEGQFTIEALAEGFRKWMSAIEIDAEKYDLKILSGNKALEELCRLEVTYNQQRLFLVNFYRKYFRTETGKRGVRGMFTVRVMNEGADLVNPGEHICLNIDDRLNVSYLGKQTNIVEALQDVLPIRDEDQVSRIVEVLGVRAEQVKMDTYQKLKEEGIHVHFSTIDDCHRFVKSGRYDVEKEWRLVIDYDGEVDSALYGDRCVWYKDFKFDGCELKEVGLRLESILIGPVQPEGTSNFPSLVQMIYKKFGKHVIVNRSGLKLIN